MADLEKKYSAVVVRQHQHQPHQQRASMVSAPDALRELNEKPLWSMGQESLTTVPSGRSGFPRAGCDDDDEDDDDDGRLARLFSALQRTAGRFGVEKRGIERVPDSERMDAGMAQIGTLWLSANMVVASFAVGCLAIPIFGLGFVDAALAIIFFNLLGILPVAFFSTFGPKFGLRQMVLSRFYFGYHGVKLIALFNILSCIGWSTVNTIVGAQLFVAINPSMPSWAGILIIGLGTLAVCLFGYRVVHAYEHWAWIPTTVIFLIVLGEFAHSGSFVDIPLRAGASEAGSVLSFAASVFGFATAWCVYAADYSVYQPAGRPGRAVFLWTFGGLFVPLVFTQLLGAAVATATSDSASSASYAEAYSSSGIGGLLAAVLVGPLGRFGQFCIAVLGLATVANNCPNVYSVSLSLQVLARATARVPRFAWTALATAAYVGLSIPGYAHFADWLENMMLLIGYWVAAYEGVSLADHFVFRCRPSFRCLGGSSSSSSGMGYAVETHTDASKLPPGFAAVGAFGFGAVGATMGMAQEWYTGPIGARCGAEGVGGDVGFELVFAFSSAAYVVLRTIERAYFKR